MSKYEVKRLNNILHGPEIELQIDERGFGRFFFDKSHEYSEQIFQIDAITGEEETYGFVNKKCVRLAMEMRKRGIGKGDVVLVCSSSNMDSIVPLISTLYLNAIAVTLDPTINLRDSTHLLKLVRPKMIFVEDVAIDLIQSALKGSQFKSQTEIVVMGAAQNYPTYAEFIRPKEEEDKFVPDMIEDIKTETAFLFFSSGTTGLPKAIEISHYSLLYMSESIISSNGFDEYSECMPFTTFYWSSAILLTFLIIRNGGRRIVIKNFQPEIALPCIERYKVKHIFLAPALTYRITDELVKKHPCPDLKSISLGGSSISLEQMKKVRNYFPHSDIGLGYAQTESGGLISLFNSSNFTEGDERKMTSSGLPLANTNIKIVDIDSEEVLGPNERGEIRVLIPSVCNGYYNQDSSITDEDGYIKTGDIGYYDDDNCLYVCDRIKDMFKYQSWHIAPLNLENVISEHPSVGEVIIIGIPREADGHIPMALVVLRHGADGVSEEDLLQFANERLSEREQLRAGLRIVKYLPKGATGKVARRQITDLVTSGQLQKLIP